MLSFNYFLHKIKEVTHPDNNNTIMLPTLISHMPKQRANVKTDQRILDAPSNQSFIGPNNYSSVHPKLP